MNRRAPRLFAACLLLAAVVPGAFAQATIPGVEAVFAAALQDMRVVGAMLARLGNAPATSSGLKNLKVGDIFINEDDAARIVTAVYESNGQIVIETDQPEPDLVVDSLYVPDFEATLSEANLTRLGKGVTIATSRDSDDPSDLIATQTTPATRDTITWMKTDPKIVGKDVKYFRFDLTLWKGSTSKDDQELLDKIKTASDRVNKGTASEYVDEQDAEEAKKKKEEGKGEGSCDISGEITLKGILSYVAPVVTGGLNKPSVKLSWIKKWWIPLPKLTFTKGYAWANVFMAEQLDVEVAGTIKLEAEYKFLIAGWELPSTGKYVKFELGLYAKVSLEGVITLSFEISEYSRLEVTSRADLVWPFIPYKASANADFYMNACFKPTITAEATVKVGPYASAAFGVLKIPILEFNAFAGGYLSAKGLIEPVGVIGYDTGIGSYGSWSDWILFVSAEAGAFCDINAKVLFWDKELYANKWPFWTYANQWEF